jgi:hypothetical protein
MKKKMIGKKGGILTDNVGWIFLLLLAILGGYWAYTTLADGLRGLDKNVEQVVQAGDFDGDGLANSIDPCPCGPNNVKREVEGTNYCVTSYAEQKCNDVGFKWDNRTNQCLYLKDQCMDYIRSEAIRQQNE